LLLLLPLEEPELEPELGVLLDELEGEELEEEPEEPEPNVSELLLLLGLLLLLVLERPLDVSEDEDEVSMELVLLRSEPEPEVLLVELPLPLSFNSELTFVTPSVLSVSAIARPIWSAEAMLPLRVTSPLCASTSILEAEAESWLSAWSLPLTIVLMTESSVLPVGAPTTLSLVRTIVVPRSRSDWISVGPRRHSVMRVVMSPEAEVELALLLVDALPEELSEPEPLVLLLRVVSLASEPLEDVFEALLLEEVELLGDVESVLATFELLEEGEVLELELDGELVLLREPEALPEAEPLNEPEPETLLELGEDDVEDFDEESLLASEEPDEDDDGELLELLFVFELSELLLLPEPSELLPLEDGLELELRLEDDGLLEEDEVSLEFSEPLPLNEPEPLAEPEPLSELEELEEGEVDELSEEFVLLLEVELEVWLELGEVEAELNAPLPEAPFAAEVELL